MERSFRDGLILLAGLATLAAALALHAILLEPAWWTMLLAATGALASAWGLYALRSDVRGLLRRRRAEIALETAGVVGVLIALAYLSVLRPSRFDFTETRRFSLSEPTVTMLKRLDRPVHVVFFHD